MNVKLGLFLAFFLVVFSAAKTGSRFIELPTKPNIASVRAAFEDMRHSEGYDVSKYESKLIELEELLSQNTKGHSIRKVLSRAIRLKREILLSNPVLDSDRILVSRYKLGKNARNADPPAMGTQPNNWTNQTSADRSGFDAEIVELSNLRGRIKRRTIFKPSNGSPVTDLMLHWDGERILFTATDKNERWNVFEVNTDGTGFRQVIHVDEPDLEFFDATYLADGRFVAVSNIGYQGVPCVNGSAAVGNLVSYDPRDQSLRRMTFDQDANWHPGIMNNGRLMYVRWEYTDLPHYCSRIVMHANPDGTGTRALYGSGSWFPNSTFDVKPIPGSTSQFVGIISGHHGTKRSGRMILFDPAKSRKEEKGMVNEFPFSRRPIIPLVKDKLVDDEWPQMIKPYPINDKYYLVSAKLDPKSLWGIYLVDIFDNMTLIAEYEGEGLIQPVSIEKRSVPPIIPDKIRPMDKNATVFIQDIYQGEGLPGVPKGEVKELRVLAYEYAYLKSPSNHEAQGIQSGWDIKRLLGTVPVEKDGSALFTVPANTPISLQPLDGEGRAMQWMRSWFSAMPGEVVSCVGCHEDQNSIPVPKRALASTKPPVAIRQPEGGPRSITFDLEIQPILDRACIACHDGSTSPDFRGFPADKQLPILQDRGKRTLSPSYMAVHPYVNRQGPEGDIAVMKPYEYHASTSELVKILKNDHYGVTLTDKEWRTLYNWIDFNAPYHGAFVANPNEFYACYDQVIRRKELSDKYANNSGVDWQREIKEYQKYLEAKGKIIPVEPEEQAKIEYSPVEVAGYPFIATAGEKRKVELAPGVELTFVKIPAGKFAMGNNNQGAVSAPASEVSIEKAFWMAETEITNQQYRVVNPGHDSRYIAQFWKDHVNPGYPANGPDQPVIRLSWEEAMSYCEKLSGITGLNVTLPTEAQWEWAARAGTDTDFWFGTLGADFGAFENLADQQLSKMVVRGVDPKPVDKKHPIFRIYDYIPRDRSVDDGNMIVADVASYKPNPWGLYDINGNVAEWTRSDYTPYPYSEDVSTEGKKKVIRGGSWIDRPKNATSYTRNAYYRWQPANNVGFRIIIEE